MFDRALLTDMVVNGMTSLIQQFLGTGDQDLSVSNLGEMSCAEWTEPKSVRGSYVSFIDTCMHKLAVIRAYYKEDRTSFAWFSVVLQINEEQGQPVLAVYEDGESENAVFIEFDMESLDFIIPPRS